MSHVRVSCMLGTQLDESMFFVSFSSKYNQNDDHIKGNILQMELIAKFRKDDKMKGESPQIVCLVQKARNVKAIDCCR